ncbi:MAG: Rieske (2Fe-2S) protein [Rhodospirillales bacterium]|nr:Rieske (2Fe-2S) protein [Rhodospirillales bacterium]
MPGRASTDRDADWVVVLKQNALAETGRAVVRVGHKQIALFRSDGQIFACNNRCPHQGYPLSEGNLRDGCVLTCNWHNWKFDLSDGATLVGGDQLRIYPVRLDGDDVLIDIAEPSPETVVQKALTDLQASFDDHEYDRMAREIARLSKAGGDPLDAVRKAILWTHERFEYGSTHAVPAAADWLAQRADGAEDEASALAALVEVVGHFAWDSRREPRYPYPTGVQSYDEQGFVDAIENEDQDTAIAMVRGAFADGLAYVDLHRGLCRAALAHYQDFGHALIYVYKTGQLIDCLADRAVALALTLMLIRSLIYARREDLIPEFRSYGPALARWDGAGENVPDAAAVRTGRTSHILELAVQSGGRPQALFETAMQAAAWQMLHFDLAFQSGSDGTISQNVGWLDFTHTLTFGNAVRKTCEKYPELWAPGLLQIFCFLGRNAGFVDATQPQDHWQVADLAGFLARQKQALIDHGQFEYIVACHRLKLLTAFAEEVRDHPQAPWLALGAAAINRFLNEPLKRKHVLRTAKQALAFVATEG